MKRALLIEVFALGMLGLANAPQAPASTLLDAATWTPHIGATLPGGLAFTDEAGRAVQLGDYWRLRPVLLALVYYGCPNLCGTVLNDMTHALVDVSLTTGRDFDVIAASIDPQETPAQAALKRRAYVARYGRGSAGGGWHFLVASPATIARLTAAVGYSYACDTTLHQFSHPAGLVAIAPGGRISGYIKGVAYEPAALNAALHEAADGQDGSVVGALLRCFHYSPLTGRYGGAITMALQVAGVLTVTGLAALVAGMLWRDWHRELAEVRKEQP
jgi:protein SCO1/2